MRGGDAGARGAGPGRPGRGGPAGTGPPPPLRPRLPLKVTAAAPGLGESDPGQDVIVPTRNGLSPLSQLSLPTSGTQMQLKAPLLASGAPVAIWDL